MTRLFCCASRSLQLGDIGEFGKKTNFEMATRIPFILRVPPALLRV